MKKIIVLLRKDITLEKINMIVVMILSIGIPSFVTYCLKDLGLTKGVDFIALLLSSLYCYFLTIGKLGMIEHKYRGTAYLTLTPISRKDIVKSRYILLFLLFGIALIGYTISYFILPFIHALSPAAIITAWFIDFLLLSVYQPLELKLGYENAKYYFMVVVVISPYLIGVMGKYGGVSIFQRLVDRVGNNLLIMAIISFILISISYFISVKVYNAKDL